MTLPAGRVAGLFRRPLPAAALIAAAVASVYANSLAVPFAYDDVTAIAQNGAIRDLAGFVRGGGLTTTRGVADLTFALNYAAGGLEVLGFHLVNVLVHLGCALLVWRLVRLTFATPFLAPGGAGTPGAEPERGQVPALVAGLLFAVHPVQTQAVTYLAQRYASLATLLYLGALVLYVGWRLQPVPWRGTGWVRFALALLLALLAMRTKEIAFTLPVVMAGYEWLFLAGERRARWLGLLPFLLTMLVIPGAALLGGIGLGDLKGLDPFAARAGSVESITRGTYLFTQARVILTYLRLLLLPVGQAFDHDYPLEPDPFAPAVVSSALALLALASAGVALVVRSAATDRRLRLAGFGVLWFFVTLSVESSVIPIDDVMVEHRLYLPSVGFALVAAAALSLALTRLASGGALARRLLGAGLAAWLLVLAGAAVARNATWADPLALLEDGVAKAPGKARAHINLGAAYVERGRLAEGMREYQEALRITPGNALVRYNLGGLYLRTGQTEAAIREYEALVRLLPEAPRSRNTLGRLYLMVGRLEEAERQYRAALALDPSYLEALTGLNRVLQLRGARPGR